jgi:prolyl-tRNA synthetase
MIGAIIMVHGDDQGLVLPPRVAPIQVVLIPIHRNDTEKTDVMQAAHRILAELKEAGIRAKMDDREEVTPGFKFNDWEMRGVPLRVELGPKDLEKGSVAVARRDIAGKANRSFIPQAGLAAAVADLLVQVQASMLARAIAFRDANIHDPGSFAELAAVVRDGWAFSWWCGRKECEAKVKDETKATTRNMPLDQPAGSGKCIVCGEPAEKKVYFARAY